MAAGNQALKGNWALLVDMAIKNRIINSK